MRKSHMVLKWVSLIWIVFFCVTSLGCKTLHKKFTRKKDKNKKKEVVVVLDPVDYGLVSQNPQEKYAHHYGAWKVWQKELLRGLSHDDTGKRLKYFTAQILMQLESMKKWVIDEKGKKLSQVVEVYQKINLDLNKSKRLQNRFLIRSKIERIGKKMRAEFGGDDLVKTDYRMPL